MCSCVVTHVVMVVVKRTMSSIEVLAMQHFCYGASQPVFCECLGGGDGHVHVFGCLSLEVLCM